MRKVHLGKKECILTVIILFILASISIIELRFHSLYIGAHFLGHIFSSHYKPPGYPEDYKELCLLKFKEEQIKRMTEALMIHYNHLSWYEAHYYSIIYYDFSKKYDIPWEIYPAVIRIESNFNPTIKSSKNAKGIAQVIESTGKEVAEKLNINYKTNRTLWNDLLNIIIGFTYLSEGAQELGLEDGLKRYNGGPGFKKSSKLVGTYKTTVWQEYIRLKYIYKGVLSEKPIKTLIKEEKEIEIDTINIAQDSTNGNNKGNSK